MRLTCHPTQALGTSAQRPDCTEPPPFGPGGRGMGDSRPGSLPTCNLHKAVFLYSPLTSRRSLPRVIPRRQFHRCSPFQGITLGNPPLHTRWQASRPHRRGAKTWERNRPSDDPPSGVRQQAGTLMPLAPCPFEGCPVGGCIPTIPASTSIRSLRCCSHQPERPVLGHFPKGKSCPNRVNQPLVGADSKLTQ